MVRENCPDEVGRVVYESTEPDEDLPHPALFVDRSCTLVDRIFDDEVAFCFWEFFWHAVLPSADPN